MTYGSTHNYKDMRMSCVPISAFSLNQMAQILSNKIECSLVIHAAVITSSAALSRKLIEQIDFLRNCKNVQRQKKREREC